MGANYHGIMISIMEGDDRNGSCGCEPYPVTKIILEGWQNANLNICQQIDTLHNETLN